MAVYEQSYRRYEGAETPRSRRFLVIPRYAYQRLFSSKLWWVLLAASAMTTIVFAVLIYVRYNARALDFFGTTTETINRIMPVDGGFFARFLAFQLSFSFVVIFAIGPKLISMDLANGGLPLYFARPISRFEYLLGKFVILGAALSILTWISGFLLVLLQVSLEGPGWALGNARIIVALFVGSWVWILVMSILTMALSALIRWPLAVRGALLTLFILLPAFGQLIYFNIHVSWGLLLSLGTVFVTVIRSLFGLPLGDAPPLAGAWMVLVGLTAVSVLVLARKLRAYEVVS